MGNIKKEADRLYEELVKYVVYSLHSGAIRLHMVMLDLIGTGGVWSRQEEQVKLMYQFEDQKVNPHEKEMVFMLDAFGCHQQKFQLQTQLELGAQLRPIGALFFTSSLG